MPDLSYLLQMPRRFALHVPLPNEENLSSYLQKWEKLKKYQLHERCLALLFKEWCSSNNNLEHVLLKVSALNDLYSTNIFDTYSVAKHICEIENIDSRLKEGDHSLVNKLAVITTRNGERNFYSFASKYCHHHCPDSFPIFDRYVERMLWHYARVDRFSSFRRDDLKHYESLVRIIEEFRTHYELQSFSLRQIDIFLWLAGRDHFPRRYNRREILLAS